MICKYCEKETVPVKDNKKIYYLLTGLTYWLYVMQKDPHHCMLCGGDLR